MKLFTALVLLSLPTSVVKLIYHGTDPIVDFLLGTKVHHEVGRLQNVIPKGEFTQSVVRAPTRFRNSVTRSLDYFFNTWPFATNKFAKH